MAHSIPDARAVALRTDAGTVLITGDYKFDQTPVDGIPADVSRLAELGREGVLCLCGDSTNADRPGVAPSESSVGPALLEVFGRCEGRIVVTSFASNVHRVQQVIDAAAQLDRRVALVGRSMRKNFNIASNLGIANGARGAVHLAEGDRGLPGREGGRDLHRQPGRAAFGSAPHGAPRSSGRRAPLRRHGDLLGDPDPRQRALGQRDDRPDLPDRRLGRDCGGRTDPRLGPRLAGGAQADAQPDQAAERLPLPRRPQAAQAARRPRGVRGQSIGIESSWAATGSLWRSTSPAPASARTSTPA